MSMNIVQNQTSKIHLILIVLSYINIDFFLEKQTIMSNYLLRYKSKLMRSELIIIPLIIIPIHLSAKLIFRIMKKRTAIHNSASFHAGKTTIGEQCVQSSHEFLNNPCN